MYEVILVRGGRGMSIARQDAWTQDEDVLLAEVVLRHIREGSTQLKAFEEVGKTLTRTGAACGFRWNSFVRQQYKTGIELAKKQRKTAKTGQAQAADPVQDTENRPAEKTAEPLKAAITLEEVIVFLSSLKEDSLLGHEQTSRLKEEVHALKQKNNELENTNHRLYDQLASLEEDYRTLLSIMERARKLVVQEGDAAKDTVRFQMEKNGNLERVHK